MNICNSCNKPNSSLHQSVDFHGNVFALTCLDCIKRDITPRLQRLALQFGASLNKNGNFEHGPLRSPHLQTLSDLKKLVPLIKTITWAVNPTGYEVNILAHGHIIESQSFGNHPQDSVAELDPDDPIALSISQLEDAARTTAQELSTEHYIPIFDIEEEINS